MDSKMNYLLVKMNTDTLGASDLIKDQFKMGFRQKGSSHVTAAKVAPLLSSK